MSFEAFQNLLEIESLNKNIGHHLNLIAQEQKRLTQIDLQTTEKVNISDQKNQELKDLDEAYPNYTSLLDSIASFLQKIAFQQV